jgi:hypothetical protein
LKEKSPGKTDRAEKGIIMRVDRLVGCTVPRLGRVKFPVIELLKLVAASG